MGGGFVVVAGGDVPAVETEKGGHRAKGASKTCSAEIGRSEMTLSPVNTDELELALMLARGNGYSKIQTKLHRWARDDPHRRFDDLFNLVTDPVHVGGGIGSAGTRVPPRPGSIDAPRRPSRLGRVSRRSSMNCGRR